MSLAQNFSLIVRPDMFIGSEFDFSPIMKLYTNLLIPSNNETFKDLSIGSKFMFRNSINNTKFQQSCVGINDNININNISHYSYNIAPGININEAIGLTVSYQGHTLETSTNLNSQPAKLLIGNLILDGNFFSYFKNQDDIQVYINGFDIFGKVLNVTNKLNYYSGNSINTILEILDNINLNMIYHINNFYNLIDKFYVRSLTTRRYTDRGSVTITNKRYKTKEYLVHINGVDNDYKCSYNMKDTLTISNLNTGQYIIRIDDHEELITILPFHY